jgi:molybdenum cofactor cytidylyltransferase
MVPRAEHGQRLSFRLERGPWIGGLSGDAGAGSILCGRPDVVACPVDDAAILRDLDTSDDFGMISPGA